MMNGVALLMAAAVLGVDYGWQPTTDGQLEYIVQIEPVTLVALRGGQELISQIDPFVRNVRRFRIRVGTEMVPRRGIPTRPPANSQPFPVPAGVQYGWQGIDSQQMEFIVQLAPDRLALLRTGEDVVGEIPVEIQNVTRLRIRSGVEPVPRQGLQVASATVPNEEPASGIQARELPSAVGSPAPAQVQGSVQAPLAAGPPIESPPRLGPESQSPESRMPSNSWPPPAQPNSANSASSAADFSGQMGRPDSASPSASGAPTQTMPSPASGPSRYSNTISDWGAGPSSAPPGQSVAQSPYDPGRGPASPSPAATGGAGVVQDTSSRQLQAPVNSPPVQEGSPPSSDRSWSGQDASRWPAPNYDPPAATGASSPQFPLAGNWSGSPAPTTTPPASSTPPTVQVPQVPQWSSGTQSGWTVSQETAWGQRPSEQPKAGSDWQGSYTSPSSPSGWMGGGFASAPSSGMGYQTPNANPLSIFSDGPLLPWEQRLLDSISEDKAGEQVEDFWASLAATANDPSLAYLRDGETAAETGDRPWGPFALTLMILFISLGGNLYMGWIAVDMYRRYLDLADDLTKEERTPRSSLDHDLDDDEDWGESRRRRERASIAA